MLSHTDKELRAMVLKHLYEQRRNSARDRNPGRIMPDGSDREYFRICQQLKEHGLITGEFVMGAQETGGYAIVDGYVAITASGVNAVEGGGAKSSIPLDFTNITQHIHISDSTGIQVGNNNIQSIVTSLQALYQQIEQCDATEPQKTEAKSLLTRLLEHPITVALVGAAAGAAIK